MRDLKTIPCTIALFMACAGTPLYSTEPNSTEPCDQLLQSHQEKQQELLVLEAIIHLQESVQAIQGGLDEIEEHADAAPTDSINPSSSRDEPEGLTAKVDALLAHAQEAHGHLQELVLTVGEFLPQTPEHARRIRDSNQRAAAAGTDLQDILNDRFTSPVERLSAFSDYALDARQALTPLVVKVALLNTPQRFYNQAIASAVAVVHRLEGQDEEHDQLLREFDPYGSYTLYATGKETHRRLMAQRRQLAQALQSLAHRLGSRCQEEIEPLEVSELGQKLDLARPAALAACEGSRSASAQKDFKEAADAYRTVHRQALAAGRVFQNAHARFSKRFAPDLELLEIDQRVARLQLGLEKRQQLIHEIDQEIEQLRRQEQTGATQTLIQDRLVQQEAESKKKEKVLTEITRQKKLRERHFRMKGFAIGHLRASAERLQQALVNSSEAQALATRAECALNRCERTWWLSKLPSLGLEVETARWYLPVALNAECEGL